MWCFGACRKSRASCEDEDLVVAGSFVGHRYWSPRRRLCVQPWGLLCSLISELGLHSGSSCQSCSIPEMSYCRKCWVCSRYPLPWGIHCSGTACDTWNSQVLRAGDSWPLGEQYEQWHWGHMALLLCASVTREDSSVLCRVHG